MCMLGMYTEDNQVSWSRIHRFVEALSRLLELARNTDDRDSGKK